MAVGSTHGGKAESPLVQGGGFTARGSGVRSNMLRPRVTPAWPSMALWCTLAYTAT